MQRPAPGNEELLAAVQAVGCQAGNQFCSLGELVVLVGSELNMSCSVPLHKSIQGNSHRTTASTPRRVIIALYSSLGDHM